jgi:hypothetical protein
MKPQSFIYPVIKESDRTFGASVVGEILNPTGDWRPSLPIPEDQNVRGVESSACYVEGQQHTLATIQEAMFNIPDPNYSARFNALLSQGTEQGGDPVKGAKSIKFDGLIPEEMMAWKNINSWADFHSWKDVDMNECKSVGKKWTKKWDSNFRILVEKDYPVEIKYLQLKEGLKRSPCPISVVAWYEKGGLYYKPEGLRDNHMVEAIYVDEQNRVHVFDTYPPYYKILTPNYNFEFAMMWTLKKTVPKNWLVDLFKRLLSIFQ